MIWRVYIKELFLGKAHGDDEITALENFLKNEGYDSLEHLASEYEGCTSDNIYATVVWVDNEKDVDIDYY